MDSLGEWCCGEGAGGGSEWKAEVGGAGFEGVTEGFKHED